MVTPQEQKRVIETVQELVKYLDRLSQNMGLNTKRTIGVIVPTRFKGVCEYLPDVFWNSRVTNKLQVDILYDNAFPQDEVIAIIRGYESSREILQRDRITGEMVGTGEFETYEEPLVLLQWSTDWNKIPKVVIRQPEFVKHVKL